MKNKATLTNYGNGILASSPDLAAIGQQYMEQLRKEEKRRQAIRDAAAAGTQEWEASRGTFGTFNISDRD
jgi:hypothetical protein